MRLSSLNLNINNVQKQKKYQEPQNLRSNSLTNSQLISSKKLSINQNIYISPYFHSKSSTQWVYQQQVKNKGKSFQNQNGIYENFQKLQEAMKNLTERIQMVQNKMKYQVLQGKLTKKRQEQRFLKWTVQKQIQNKIEQELLKNNDKIFREIKKLEQGIDNIFQQKFKKSKLNKKTNEQLELNPLPNKNIKFQILEEKNTKLIQQKIKQEFFKIQIHLQNDINKMLSKINNNNERKNISVMSRSKLKYKYQPLQINIKNQLSVNKNQSEKRKYNSLSTTNSSGSSSQSQQNQTRTRIQVQEIRYYVDKEGYLLDQNGFYLLNNSQKMIRIDKDIIRKLKQFQIIE